VGPISFCDRVEDVLLTERLSSPPYAFRRLCDQDTRRLIDGKADTLPKPKASSRPMLRQLKPNEVHEIVKAYEAGSTPNELAARFRVHRTTVMANLRKRGVTIRRTVPRLSPESVDEAATLYRDGWSLSQLAARFETTGPTVGRALRKVGVKIRSGPGWAAK
jgi:hypothetical protein